MKSAAEWLGLDIGGANLKWADGKGLAQSVFFPLWKEPEQLALRLQTLLNDFPAETQLAVTMTGELADCFATKAAGVTFILNAVQAASAGRKTLVYLTDGRLVSPATAVTQPMLAAASNWHLLARFAGRLAPQGSAMLLDVGSTTCDIIPLRDGQVVAHGKTDTTRLLAGELLYTGIERSPCAAITTTVPYRGQRLPIVQELFATMRDVYIVLRELPPEDDRFTADGQPASYANSVRRLGRMVAADETEFTTDDALELARSLASAQQQALAAAIQQVTAAMTAQPRAIVLSGHGEFLARHALAAANISVPLVSLQGQLGPLVTRCATAHALAVLAREECA